MTPKTEADIARQVAASLELEGWECFPEVQLRDFLRDPDCPNGIADLVAVKGRLVMAVEAKRSLSLDLLDQAISWARFFPLVACAVPFSALKHRTGLREHLRDYFGVGLYGVSTNHVNFSVRPRLLRHNLRNVDKIKSCLDDRMKLSTAGAANTYRHSPYQDLLWHTRVGIARNGPMTKKALIELLTAEHGHFHYSSAASMRQQLSTAIDTFEADLSFDRDDGLVRWDPTQCAHGDAYVKRIRDVAAMKPR